MIGGGEAKENTLFTMNSCQWLTVPQRISAGRRAHVTRAEEGGNVSIEEAAPRCTQCNQGVYAGMDMYLSTAFVKRLDEPPHLQQRWTTPTGEGL
jgi:hypothetical protein